MQKNLFILLLFLLPTIIFSKTDNLVTNTIQTSNQTNLTALLSLVSNISETVHSLQQERGASCGFVSSNGEKFRSKLDSIKIDSDLKIKSLLINFNTHKTLLDHYFSSIEYDNINTKFNELYLLRADVKNLKTDFANVYSKYTQIIAFLLLNISDISDKPKNKELRDKLYTYSILLMYKESVGQKRAALNALFSQKIFSKEIYEYFLTSDTQEKIYLKTFLHNVDKNIKDLYYSNLDNNSVSKVKEYEKLALDKLNGKVIDVNPLKWFTYVTKKVNLIKGVELYVFDTILTLVDELNNISSNTDNKELNIAFHFDRPPYMFGKTSSKGIEADLVKEIFQSQGYKVNIHQMAKQNMEKLLTTNSNFDGVSSVSDTGDGMFYSDHFISYENYVITYKKDNLKIKSLEDLKNINFVAWKDAYNDLGDQFYKLFNPIDGDYRSSYHDKTSQKEQHKLFFDKKVDAIVVDKTIFEWYKLAFKNNDDFTFHKIFPKLTTYPAKFKSKTLRDAFNKGLKIIKETKRYDEIVEFYLSQDIRPLLKYSNIVADISGKFIFSAKPLELKKILTEFFQHPDILHIEVFDKTINANFISLYKKDGKIIDAEDMDEYHNLPSIKKDIYFSNKGNPLHVGKVEIFYKKEFDNKNGVLIPNLNHFVDLDKDDLLKIQSTYDKFELNTKTITLSKSEKEWIKTHPSVKFTGDPNWLPFEAFDSKGSYIGIVSDYLKKIESLTGIKFEKIATKSWSDSVELSQTKKVDILSESTEADRKYLTFTKPYIKNDIIIIMDKEHNYVENLKKIRDKKIAVIKDYGYVKQIEETYPKISFIEVESIKDGLSAVSTGKVDALVCTFALGTYTITSMGLSNIKIVGKTKFFTTLGLGVRNDYPILVEILNKAIDSITQQEHNEIFNRWIKQNYIEKIDYTLLYKVSGGAFVLILMFIFWNRKMATEIDKRKIAEEKIKESQARFTSMVSNVPGVIYRCLLDEHYTMLYISDEIQRLSGYPPSDYLNNSVRTFADIIHPDDSEYVAWYIQKQIDNKKPYIVDYRIIHKNGDVLWVRGEGKALWSNDNVGWLDGAIFDISSQKEAQKELEISKLKLDEEKNFIASIISSSQDALIVIDKNSIITTWNNSATTIFGYTKEEMIEQTIQKIIPHKFRELHTQGVHRILSNGEQKLLGKGAIEIEGLHKNGTIIPIDLALNTFTINNEIFFSANIRDISERKELVDKINSEKQFTQTLLDSQEQLIITTDGETLISANKTFLDFYAIDSIENFTDRYNANCICDTFNTKAPEGYLQIMMGDKIWIDYVISRSFGVTHKVMITRDDKDFIFSVSATKLPRDKGLKSAVFTNITEMEQAKQEIETINKHTRESIEYASLIQGALIPDNKIFNKHFQDYFTIWHPKDTVGGDIYLFEELRDKDECLLMVIDCTGHGVPGAFVTMLVKAIERQVISKINSDLSIEVSPAWILNYFNRHMKQLLKQESVDSISNAGFDGGIIYYNKKDKIIKFAGAETPLFYVEDEELKVIKGSRYSVGYKKCDMDYEYKEHTIEVREGMQFYLTTDGYLDQNGGEKSFPFGKKRFQNIIKVSYQEDMPKQKEMFLSRLGAYQMDEERNDDVTLVGFKI